MQGKTLVIGGEDIRYLALGLLEGDRLVFEEKRDAAPEEFLSVISSLLSDHGLDLKEIRQLMVVAGPGSFNACRVSTTIANVLAYRFNLPIFSLENPSHLSLADLLAQADLSVLEAQPFVTPAYDRPPTITHQKAS